MLLGLIAAWNLLFSRRAWSKIGNFLLFTIVNTGLLYLQNTPGAAFCYGVLMLSTSILFSFWSPLTFTPIIKDLSRKKLLVGVGLLAISFFAVIIGILNRHRSESPTPVIHFPDDISHNPFLILLTAGILLTLTVGITQIKTQKDSDD